MPIIEYTVQPGDTIYGIARRYGVTPQSIIQLNNLTNPDFIVPGQRLLIDVEETEPTPPPPGTKTYIVQPGDTLYSIAQRTGVTVDQIVRLNNIQDPNRIFPGQMLLLPPEAQLPDVPPGFFRYTIRSGDTLYSIARRYGTTVSALINANPGIDPNNLRIGQQILVPTTGLATPIFRGNSAKRMIAFTFDATYGDNQTERILNILRQNGIRATWFISGIWAENFPTLLRSIHAAGHEIGNHSHTHPHMTQLSAAEMRSQITNASRAIERVIGVQVDMFRPPFGEYNQTLLNVAAGLGYRTIMWTIDSLDWQNPGPDAIVNRVLSNATNGAIILMHNSAPDTPNALPRIIDELRRRGFSFGTVSEVIDP
ncbi:MAG: LysM peptidoglycan-binding domain-containing protein [Thermosediminibacteraceae bacterium]|nr:LysM peptidoglycan-binding domain-containing protein [Thermosediminibacteraceae bacterium]